ncbi:response regulator [Streptomyces sp. NPDC002221]|uniref:response regulator n=1 Tax=Streptomyces sp. NPDC002221 TaxID=3364639 RepID=UPI00369CF3E0
MSRILIVEDEVSLTSVLRRGFEAEGLSVDVAHDGNEGLRLALTDAYDVIVLDVMLPGLDGHRVCRTVRAAGLWTPILMLTAKDSEYDEAEGLDTGADDYLTKPFSYLATRASRKPRAGRRVPAGPRALRHRSNAGNAGRARSRHSRARALSASGTSRTRGGAGSTSGTRGASGTRGTSGTGNRRGLGSPRAAGSSRFRSGQCGSRAPWERSPSSPSPSWPPAPGCSA